MGYPKKHRGRRKIGSKRRLEKQKKITTNHIMRGLLEFAS